MYLIRVRSNKYILCCGLPIPLYHYQTKSFSYLTRAEFACDVCPFICWQVWQKNCHLDGNVSFLLYSMASIVNIATEPIWSVGEIYFQGNTNKELPPDSEGDQNRFSEANNLIASLLQTRKIFVSILEQMFKICKSFNTIDLYWGDNTVRFSN